MGELLHGNVMLLLCATRMCAVLSGKSGMDSFADATGIVVKPVVTEVDAPGHTARTLADMMEQSHTGEGPITLQPRPAPPQAAKVKRPKWTFETSIFAKYKEDTEATLDKAFEIDWGYGKVGHYIFCV